MEKQRIVFHHLSIPLKHRFDTAQSELIRRDIGLVEYLASGTGSAGWGEASPFPGQDDSIIDFLSVGRSGRVPATLRSGLEAAQADFGTRARGEALSKYLGSSREKVPVSLAVGIGGNAPEIVDEAVARGVNRFKLKISPNRLSHVRQIRGDHPEAILGVDANGSFEPSSADQLASLADLGLAYIEEPCSTSDWATLVRLKQLIDVPVFADESVRSIADARVVLDSPLIDGVVVKPARLGLAGSIEAAKLADASGKRWRASGLFESGIGRAYTEILAAMPSAFLSDVAPADWFFERDVVPSRFEGGHIAIPAGPGIGVEPDRDVVERYLVASYDISELVTESGVQALDR
ncbi:MAG: hypothetical protein O3B42_03365 [Actinomycetota bacterium]|nr:hypothetical protein [Actinomycetota bacterium]